MSVLRTYGPIDCDSSGELLDWERCRHCDGPESFEGKRNAEMRDHDPSAPDPPCPVCGVHGSLKAAVLAELIEAKYANAEIGLREDGYRCESCSHPMGAALDPQVWGTHLDAVMYALGRGVEPGEVFVRGVRRVHYSACDSLCDHGGPGRGLMSASSWRPTDDTAATRTMMLTQASWRPVEVRRGMIGRRTLGDRFDPSNVLHVRPWDLRRENVAVLCLRCFAEAGE